MEVLQPIQEAIHETKSCLWIPGFIKHVGIERYMCQLTLKVLIVEHDTLSMHVMVFCAVKRMTIFVYTIHSENNCRCIEAVYERQNTSNAISTISIYDTFFS